MAVVEWDDKGDPKMRENLKRVGVGGSLSADARVVVLQQQVAELITALEKAGIKTTL